MQTYLVGGAVRDKLLGYPIYDRDWVVVGATPAQMLGQGFQPVGADFPVFIHPVSGEEYALARTERKSGHGYGGFVYHASPDVTLEQDLLRRDLTINAMAEAPDGTLTDPYGGQKDLADHVLRHVSPAFAEDPLRVLRVARFAARYARLGFHIADETLALMETLSTGGELLHLSVERVWQEFERALGETSPGVFIDVLQRCKALSTLFSEFEPLQRHPAWPALARDLPALQQTRERFAVLCTAALGVHAVSSRGTDAQDIRCGIDSLDCHQIEAFCQRLKAPNAFRDQALLVCRHLGALLRLPQAGADERLALACGLDLLRRPERMASLASCVDCLGSWLDTGTAPARPMLEALHGALTATSPAQLMQQGFSGKALGDELRRRQQEACAKLEFGDGDA
jgi:tRNA nucleotidyltransferase (CCA-adding enzyme)